MKRRVYNLIDMIRRLLAIPWAGALVMAILALLISLVPLQIANKYITQFLYANKVVIVHNQTLSKKTVLESELNSSAAYLQSISSYAIDHLREGIDFDEEVTTDFADGLLRSQKSIVGLGIFVNNQEVVIYPRNSITDLIQQNINWADPKISDGKPLLIGPVRAANGKIVLIAYQKDVVNGIELGTAIIIQPEETIQQIQPADSGDLIVLVITGPDGQVLFGNPLVLRQRSVLQSISSPFGVFKIAAIPKGGWDMSIRDQVRLTWLIGFAILLLINSIFFLLVFRHLRMTLSIKNRTQALEREFQERLQVQDDLAVSQSILFEASRRAQIGIWDFNILTEEFYWSPELRSMIKKAGMTDLDSMESILPNLNSRDRRKVEKCWRIVISQGVGSDTEIQIERRNDVSMIVWVTFNPRFDANGKVIAIWGLVQDITERKGTEKQLQRLNRSWQMISRCGQSLVRIDNESELLNEICQLIVEIGGYRLAWVGMAVEDAEKSVRPIASYGDERDYLNKIQLSWENLPTGNGPIGVAIRTGRMAISKDMQKDRTIHWKREAQLASLTSFVAFPIDYEKGLRGVLSIYTHDPNGFNSDELNILKQLADDISYGVRSIRSRQAYQSASDALRQSEERYRLITDNMTESIWVMDLNLNTIYMSPSVSRNRGFSNKELLQMRLEQQLTPESGILMLKELKRDLRAVRSGKESHVIPVMELEFYQKDGSTRWSEVSTTILRNAAREPVSILCVGRDITDRRKVQEALRTHEERWEIALESSGDGVWDWDLKTDKVFFSRRWKQMLGFKEDEITNSVEEWSSRVHPDDIDWVEDEVRRHIRGEIDSYHTEHRMKCKDGSYKWVLDRGKVIKRDDDGTALRMVGTHTDMTESRNMQQAVFESELQFRMLAENSTDLISRHSLDGTYLYASPASIKLLGYEPYEMVGTSIFSYIHPEDRSIVQFVIGNLSKTPVVPTIQYRVIRKDHGISWFDTSIRLVSDPKTGEPLEIQKTSRDITDRIKAQMDLRESEEKLRSLINSSADGIILTDEEGRIIEWNAALSTISGKDSSSVVNRYIWDVQPDLLPLDTKRYPSKVIKELVTKFLTTGSYGFNSTILQGNIYRSDGSAIPIQATTFPIRTPRGYMAGAIIRDVTALRKAEAALRESQEQLNFIADHMADLVTYVDRDLVIQFASPSHQKGLGYIPEQLLDRKLTDVIHEEDRQLLLDEIEAAVKGFLPEIYLRARFLHADGSYRWMESTGNILIANDGSFQGAVFNTRDFTERKKKDDALRESETRYRTLARNFPNGSVMLFDHDLRYTVADGTGLADIGLSREILEGKTIYEVFTEDTIRVLEPYYKAVLKGRTEIFELPMNTRVNQIFALPVKDDDGEIVAGMVMTQDITERKDAVNMLSQRAQYLSSLNKITRLALEKADLGEMAQEMADELAAMFEADACYITSWDDDHQKTIPLAATGAMREQYTKMEFADGQHTLTYSVMHAGHPIVIPDMFDTPYIDANLALKFPNRSAMALPLIGGNQKLGAVLFGYVDQRNFTEEDITRGEHIATEIALGLYKQSLLAEIRRSNIALEQRVVERTADLERKNKELETFTYSVSHDLKAPLRGIEGYSRLLVEDHSEQLDDEGRSFLENIRNATGQMNELIEDLLSYSRLERRAFTAEKIDIHALIEHLLLEKQGEIESRKAKVKIVGEIPSVMVDGSAIDQALRNLLDNALKFSRHARQPIINISLTDEGDSIVIAVKDNGIGFDMKYNEKIFDIFQRLHLQDDYPGTGIGLALVKKAMQRIGGDCWATGAEGKGATFYLRIPKGDHQ